MTDRDGYPDRKIKEFGRYYIKRSPGWISFGKDKKVLVDIMWNAGKPWTAKVYKF